MIFVKENFSLLGNNFLVNILYCEQLFKDSDLHNLVNANMSLLKNNHIFLYLKFKNEIGIESESYYHIVSDNEDDYEKIKKLIHSKVTIRLSYFYFNEESFNEYMNKLYPEIVGNYTYGNFLKKLGDFDKVVEYNWEYFKISDRVKLVKYALGLDYINVDNFSNKIYSEIKSRFKNREINSLEENIKIEKEEDSMRSLYEMSQEARREKENCSMINIGELFNEMFEETKRREEAHILTPKIESIYVNKEKRTTVIKWKTGATTKVTCHESDTWDLEKGIMACITKYVLGNNYNAGNILNKYIGSVKYTDSK